MANHTDCAYQHTQCEKAVLELQAVLKELESVLGTTKNTDDLHDHLAFAADWFSMHAEALRDLKERHDG